nr:hypothetical protein [Tanacetum cinerariifolium]
KLPKAAALGGCLVELLGQAAALGGVWLAAEAAADLKGCLVSAAEERRDVCLELPGLAAY